MKHQALFSLKNSEKVFMNAVSFSCDWSFRVKKSLCNMGDILLLWYRIHIICNPPNYVGFEV